MVSLLALWNWPPSFVLDAVWVHALQRAPNPILQGYWRSIDLLHHMGVRACALEEPSSPIAGAQCHFRRSAHVRLTFPQASCASTFLLKINSGKAHSPTAPSLLCRTEYNPGPPFPFLKDRYALHSDSCPPSWRYSLLEKDRERRRGRWR